MISRAVKIRPMRPSDVPALDALLRAAYGQPDSFAGRLTAYLTQRGVRTFVAALGRRPAGLVIGNDYGTTAYVSLMGVDPSLQRRGIATLLMEALVGWVRERGFADVQLDATTAGEPLYRRFGFADDGETLVFSRNGGAVVAPPGVRPAVAGDRTAILALDRDAFGADRSAMLSQLLDHRATDVFVAGDVPRGYVVVTPVNVGPLVAPAEDAPALLDAACAARGSDTAARVCAVGANPRVAPLLASRGFTQRRALRHMTLGRRRPVAASLYARANLGQG